MRVRVGRPLRHNGYSGSACWQQSVHASRSVRAASVLQRGRAGQRQTHPSLPDCASGSFASSVLKSRRPAVTMRECRSKTGRVGTGWNFGVGRRIADGSTGMPLRGRGPADIRSSSHRAKSSAEYSGSILIGPRGSEQP